MNGFTRYSAFIFLYIYISSFITGCASISDYYGNGEYFYFYEGDERDLVSMRIVQNDENGDLFGVEVGKQLRFDIEYDYILPLSSHSALAFTYDKGWFIDNINGLDKSIDCLGGLHLSMVEGQNDRVMCLKKDYTLPNGEVVSDMTMLSPEGEEIIFFPRVIDDKASEADKDHYRIFMQHGVATMSYQNKLKQLYGEGEARDKLVKQVQASLNDDRSLIYQDRFTLTQVNNTANIEFAVRRYSSNKTMQDLDFLDGNETVIGSLDNVFVEGNSLIFEPHSKQVFIRYQDLKKSKIRTAIFDQNAKLLNTLDQPLENIKTAYFTHYSDLQSTHVPMLRLGRQAKPLDSANPYLYQPIGRDGKPMPFPDGVIGLAPILLKDIVITWVTVSDPSKGTEYRMGGNHASSVIERYDSLEPLKAISKLSILDTPYQTVQGYDVRSLMAESRPYMLEPLPVGELKFPVGNNKWVGTTPKYALSNGLTSSSPDLAIAMRLFEDPATRRMIEYQKETEEMHRKQASKVAYAKQIQAETDEFWRLINQTSSSQSRLASLANKLGCEAISAYINRFGKGAARDVPEIKYCAINLNPERKVVDGYTPQDWSNSSLGLGGVGDARSQAAKDEAYRNALEDQIRRSTGGQGRGAAW